MKKKYLLINAVVSILLGSIAYYLFFPQVKFAKAIDALLQTSFHFQIDVNNVAAKLIRFYLMDALWANALMSLTLWLFGYQKTVIIMVLTFEAVMELAQIFQCVNGTFDVWDIVVEISSGILVILLFWRIKNEKK